MKDGLLVPALLRFIGQRASQRVLEEFDRADREEFALAAADLNESDSDREDAIHMVSEYLRIRNLVAERGVEDARIQLARSYDEEEAEVWLERVTSSPSLLSHSMVSSTPDRSTRLATADCALGARAFGYLPVDHGAEVLLGSLDRFVSRAMAFDAIGGLDSLVAALEQLEPKQLELLLEMVSTEEPSLACRIKVRLSGIDHLTCMDDETLVGVLDDLSIEELSLGLMGASLEVRQRCELVLDGSRRALLGEEFRRSNPVQIWEMDEAQQRIAGAMSRAVDARYGRTEGDACQQERAMLN